ncbi:hypothetical protein M0811_02084 [Anaeramoeba ignava]|uniref:Uncharacterized protein n=1 Tax=Anaeramoeba ignava TaxID=1746090 RepID=A0A9Q0LBV0_ANAIG|nr:hypothetical protein M0811_02084 [Anaeramoeba ignava]
MIISFLFKSLFQINLIQINQLQTIYKLITQGTAINTYSPGREDKCYPGIPSILKMKQKKKSSKKEKEKEETQSIQKKEETDKLIQNKNFKFKADSFINSNQTSDFFEQCEKSNLGFMKTKSFYSQETNFPYYSKSKIFAIDFEIY